MVCKFFLCSTNIPRGLSPYKPQKLVIRCLNILSTFRNNLSNNTTQNRLLITSVKIDIFTKSLEVTVHNFWHFLSTILRIWALFGNFLLIFASTFLAFSTSAIGKGLFVGVLISKHQDFIRQVWKGLVSEVIIRLLLAMDAYQLNLETFTFHEEIQLFIKW